MTRLSSIAAILLLGLSGCAGGPPTSFYTLDPIPAEAARVMGAGVTLAISVEPLGGSPTGKPTGPVILSGKLQAA